MSPEAVQPTHAIDLEVDDALAEEAGKLISAESALIGSGQVALAEF